MVKLYSTGCPRCNILKKKLDAAGIHYILIDDMTSIEELCKKLNVDTVPILAVSEQHSLEVIEYMDFSKAIKWVGELN